MKTVSFLALTLALVACSTGNQEIEKVPIEEYVNIEKCWTNKSGDFSAIIILLVNSDQSIPFLLSHKCELVVPGLPPGEGFLGRFDPVKISGDNGLLKEMGIHDRHLSPNYIIHGYSPELKSKMYKFTGKITMTNPDSGGIYDIAKVDSWSDMGINLEQYYKKPYSEKVKILGAI